MKNVLILGANGQIARIVAKRLLSEQDDVQLTLYLRKSHRVDDLVAINPARVRTVDADIHDQEMLDKAVQGQDIVFISNVDHDPDNKLTQGVIAAMIKNDVKRVIASNVLGIYGEVPGEYGRWNTEMLTQAGLNRARRSDELLEKSGLNDRDEVKYSITHKGESYVGVSGSRQSIADVVVKMIADPTYLNRESIGLADPDTQGLTRPVY